MENITNRTNAGADRQWDLMRASFDGDWLGMTTWYGRDAHGMDLNHGTCNPTGSLYAIRFSDADTGEWHGTGLRFAPGRERRFPLNRHHYNLGNNCWHFPETAGQSSLEMGGSAARAGHEVNFFTGRSRSMLVALYQRQADGRMILDSIAAIPFRCKRAHQDPVREQPESLDALFMTVAGWPGVEQELRPGLSSELATQIKPLKPFNAESLCRHDVNGFFLDNLICSLPGCLPEGSFALHFGCLLDASSFVHLIIDYDENHQLIRWVERRYHPTMHG
ncbi:MAG: hypothetical protein ACRC1L_01920 [Prochlorococcaceae cyanobacterium]